MQVEMQLERIVGEFFAGAERVVDVAVEARERRRRRIRIDAVARVFGASQRQALIVVEQHERAPADSSSARFQPRPPPNRARPTRVRSSSDGSARAACGHALWRADRRDVPARRRRDRSACSRSRARTRAADRGVGSRRGRRRIVDAAHSGASCGNGARSRPAISADARAARDDRRRG